MRGLARLFRELRSVRRFAGWGTAARYAAKAALLAPAVLRSGSLHPVDDAFGTGPFEAEAFGCRVTVDGASFGLLREIYGRRAYLPPGFGIRPGETVVDLGAHVGTFTVLAAKLGARVVAVEAEPSFASQLEANLRRNGVNATVVRGRIGRSPPLTVDGLIERHDLGAIDLLKIDVEGDEFDLLTSGPPWLDRVRRIAMEVHPAAGDPAELARAFSSRGFSVELADAGYLFARRRS